MSTPLSYVGPAPSVSQDLVTEAYVAADTGGDLTQSAVSSLLTSGFAPYVTKAYVDTQDAALATPAYCDAVAAELLQLNQIGVANGVAGLDVNGRVSIDWVDVTSTQRFPVPFYSPAAYNTSTVSSTGAEVQLYTVSVADPALALGLSAGALTYKLLVHGTEDVINSADSVTPLIRVRRGSQTGQIVAAGAGLSESYPGGVQNIYGQGSYTYTSPIWAVTVDVVALGGGGPGSSGGDGFEVVDGEGGSPGGYSWTTLTDDVNLPSLLNISVGGEAQSSSVSGTGMSTVTGGGGTAAASGSKNGGSPGNLNYDGYSYVGGGTQTSLGGAGGYPGGGGAGGAWHLTNPGAGGLGAAGAVWITAFASTHYPSGAVTIIPAPFNTQTSITGATTLYVMLANSGGGTSTASTVIPKLHVVAVPA